MSHEPRTLNTVIDRRAHQRAPQAPAQRRRVERKWQKSVGDEGFLESIVDRWRNASSAAGPETAHQVRLFAEAVNLPPMASELAGSGGAEERSVRLREAALTMSEPRRREQAPTAPSGGAQAGSALRALRDRLQQR